MRVSMAGVIPIMISNADITLYNKYVDPATRSYKYQRMVIRGVMWQGMEGVWQAAQALAGAKSGKLLQNLTAVYIPFALGWNYRKPKAWRGLSVKTGYWTLQDDDVIVRGIVSDEITDAVIDPPAPAFTISDLLAKYDDSMTVFTVATNDVGSVDVKHWHVLCR